MKARNFVVAAGFVIVALAIAVLISGCSQQVAVEEPEVTAPAPVSEEPEGPEPYTLVWWTGYGDMKASDDCANWEPEWCERLLGAGEGSFEATRIFVEKWHEEFPEYALIDIKPIPATHGKGDVGVELVTLIKGGEGPDIFTMYGGRAGAIAKAIGINHDEYLTDEQKGDYLDYESMFWGDTIPMLESAGNFSYPVLNVTLIERACAQEGFDCEVPEPWSILSRADWEEMAVAVKALDDESYMGVWWGQDKSSQQLTWGYLANAGIRTHIGGEFTGFPGAERMINLINDYYDAGYFVPGAAGLNDSVGFDIWARGKIGLNYARLGYQSRSDKLFASGEIDVRPQFIPLIAVQWFEDAQPLVNGARMTTVSFVAEKCLPEHRDAAVSFVHFVNRLDFRRGLVDMLPAVRYQLDEGVLDAEIRGEILDYIAEHGMSDDGVPNPAYQDVRQAWSDSMTAMFLDKATPEEALELFRARVTELQEK